MKAIAAVDKNWAIGRDNALLISIPEDMKFFREKTMGQVVVMGRKTLESFPQGNPLKNRVNIVLTRNPFYEKEGVIAVAGRRELERELKNHADKEIFVIGGESIYRQLLDLCDEVFITKVDAEYEADAFFPSLDELPEWVVVSMSEGREWEGIGYSFITYKRK
ncbi:MAG: dihydrofolate reductase [Lachnospiraceae bacterium]|jgi:dihydrofolate reductase